jgi:hypothetical protein
MQDQSTALENITQSAVDNILREKKSLASQVRVVKEEAREKVKLYQDLKVEFKALMDLELSDAEEGAVGGDVQMHA